MAQLFLVVELFISNSSQESTTTLAALYHPRLTYQNNVVIDRLLLPRLFQMCVNK